MNKIIIFIFVLITAVSGQFSLTLTWDPNPADDNVEFYRIYRSVGNMESFVKIDSTVHPDTLYCDSDSMMYNTIYAYFLDAINFAGLYSDHSDTVWITVLDDTSLPAVLSIFDLILTADYSVKIIWRTESEINNSDWYIQRRQDGYLFEDIVSVPGQGSTSTATDYEYIDSQVVSGLTYIYRLKSVDYNGAEGFFPEKSITIDVLNINRYDSLDELVYYPNPALNYVNLKVPEAGKYNILIYNVLGQEVFSGQYWSFAGASIQLHIGSLPSGAYIIKLIFENRSKARRLIIQK